jgi:hypothetical protein
MTAITRQITYSGNNYQIFRVHLFPTTISANNSSNKSNERRRRTITIVTYKWSRNSMCSNHCHLWFIFPYSKHLLCNQTSALRLLCDAVKLAVWKKELAGRCVMVVTKTTMTKSLNRPLKKSKKIEFNGRCVMIINTTKKLISFIRL